MDATRQAEQVRDALCWECGYALRGLASPRCPECGRPFDPHDPRTMNVGRPLGPIARRMLAPAGARIWWLYAFAAVAFLWGWAWLPGGLVVTWYAVLVILALYTYRAVRLLLREIILRRYAQRRNDHPAVRAAPHAPALVMLVLFTCIAFNLPLRLTLAVTHWISGEDLWRTYAIDPMPATSLGPQFLGLIYARSLDVSPGGVHIHVAGAGTLEYAANGTQDLVATGMWSGFGILDAPPPVPHVFSLVIAGSFFWIAWSIAVTRQETRPLPEYRESE